MQIIQQLGTYELLVQHIYQLEQPQNSVGTVRVPRSNDWEINRFDKWIWAFSNFIA
jgi:hypothetical protein